MSHMHKLTPLLALYLYRCFQEADEKLSEVVAESFDGYVDLNECRLLPHHLAYLGFFLSNFRCKEWAELNLCGCHVGDHGIHILYQGMKAWNLKIRTVDLRNNSLTGASSQIIGSLALQTLHLVLSRNEITMVKNMLFTRTVKVLHLEDINCKIPDIELISGMITFLEELDISYNGLGNDGVTLLSKGIAKTGTLKVLNINNNNIGPSGCVALKDALIKNTSLVELRVGNNAIGEDGISAVISIIANSSTLKKLYINNTNIGLSGFKTLVPSVTKNSLLELLNVDENDIGQDGANYIASLIATNTLKELFISRNNIGPSGARTIANCLENNTSLEKLYMNQNGKGPEGVTAFATVIPKNKTLKTLSLSYDYTIDQRIAMEIIGSLKYNKTITILLRRNHSYFATIMTRDLSKFDKNRVHFY
ncbi:NLR family CARD domain-containing protein 3-like [Dysidea avara]|uniref:NLR family CARD domain-containing protein 3-like n=1 Tax=Dysidea avara TaxID=196820 RepID=UPI00333005F6